MRNTRLYRFLSWLLRHNPYRTVRHVEYHPMTPALMRWYTIDPEAAEIRRVQDALRRGRIAEAQHYNRDN